MHSTDVAPEGVASEGADPERADAPTAAGAASEEAEEPATAGTSPNTGVDGNTMVGTFDGGTDNDSLLCVRFIRGGF